MDSKYPEIAKVRDLLGESYTEDMKFAFPEVDPPTYPFGALVLCQIRSPKKFKRLPGGKIFLLADETVDAEKYRVQVGLVRAVGPAAFKNRATGVEWPEGMWCKPGDFVRVPLYGGDRESVDFKDGELSTEALFVMVRDTDITGGVRGDPLMSKALI